MIQSRSNQTLKHLARLGREKKYRRETGEMLCEGEKMLREALLSGAEMKNILVCEKKYDEALDALIREAEAGGASVFIAEEPLFRMASQVEAPQGVVFSCAQPQWGNEALNSVNQALILDGVQDPGNLGTILRTAEAFALDAVVLCEGCAEPYSPKVVRSTMGAVFRMPCPRLAITDAAGLLKRNGLRVYAAALHGESISVHEAELGRAAVIIGSEGHGVSEAALRLCDGCMTIPMRGRAESLNAGVAASIVIYEMTKQEARQCR